MWNVGRFCSVNWGVGLILRRLRSGGSVRILRFFGGGSPWWLNEVLGKLLMLGLNIVDGTDRLHGRRPRGRSIADPIERLAGVKAETCQSYRAYQ